MSSLLYVLSLLYGVGRGQVMPFYRIYIFIYAGASVFHILKVDGLEYCVYVTTHF